MAIARCSHRRNVHCPYSPIGCGSGESRIGGFQAGLGYQPPVLSETRNCGRNSVSLLSESVSGGAEVVCARLNAVSFEDMFEDMFTFTCLQVHFMHAAYFMHGESRRGAPPPASGPGGIGLPSRSSWPLKRRRPDGYLTCTPATSFVGPECVIVIKGVGCTTRVGCCSIDSLRACLSL